MANRPAVGQIGSIPTLRTTGHSPHPIVARLGRMGYLACSTAPSPPTACSSPESGIGSQSDVTDGVQASLANRPSSECELLQRRIRDGGWVVQLVSRERSTISVKDEH
jgi:hypothetical protein